jgi:hypothetical protein
VQGFRICRWNAPSSQGATGKCLARVYPDIRLMSCDQFPLGSQAFAQHTVDRVWSRLPRRSIVRGRINDTRRKNVSKLKHLRAARFANLSARSCQRA